MSPCPRWSPHVGSNARFQDLQRPPLLRREEAAFFVPRHFEAPMNRTTPTMGILHEHPDWFRPLFAELDRRGLPWEAVPAAGHSFDPGETTAPHPLVLNRMSPSAWLRGGASQVFHTTPYLEHLEGLGVQVINGSRAWGIETSKAAQLSLLRSLGLPFPRARAVHDPDTIPHAARDLRFPVVVKPNVGGSGAGVVRFETPEELAAAVLAGSIDLGIDGTGLVQEFIPARDGRIVRVEVLNGRVLYAIRIYTSGDELTLCPADVCRGVDGAERQRPACPPDAPANDHRGEAYTP
ncbi:MAG: hypothetical protein EA352_12095, partial [Gemmatimonadales bacterium]